MKIICIFLENLNLINTTSNCVIRVKCIISVCSICSACNRSVSNDCIVSDVSSNASILSNVSIRISKDLVKHLTIKFCDKIL